MNIQKLFKPYFVRRKNGQCQVLIPLVELDELCEKIESYRNQELEAEIERLKRCLGHRN